ncbi:MAG: DUF2911 domain-containing protein [Schleiferiaceae bacterium]|jgi:hypothetical protein|nr:DUF2911 domain-containing protein [Flavobacteriia bacterium]NDA07156.1 DUF2911 domain-containing protein [Flavobacteriia bacterium]NDA27988.1 DUF2911 domain-containing protein [Flavobacteriia bacterium]NDD80207.1 DUF2911 domain-containing protein [Flavobacteriia bacterium]
MKKILTSLAVLATIAAGAQDLPQPSPSTHLEQRVGLTDITLDYSRPSVNGRVIFGDLVPFGSHWRAGANQNTKVTFSKPVTIAGTDVAAGTYSLSMIPNKGTWTVILNTKTDMWGVDGYSQEQDVLRVEVTPQAIAPVETMRMSLENITVSNAEIVLDWSDVRIALPVELNTMELATANIDAAIAAEPENWRVYRNAANFYNQNNIELATALTYMEKSIALNPDSWYSYYLYAQVLAKNDRKKEAKKAASKALEMGRAESAKNNAPFNYADTIKRFVSDL